MPPDAASRKSHWEGIYKTKPLETVGWYQPVPGTSLELIAQLELADDTAVIDIGGGDSYLTDRLLDIGFSDLTVLDISRAALNRARLRLNEKAAGVQWVESDILSFIPERKYTLWHDRAVFHFLTEPGQVAQYLTAMHSGLELGGYLILATFSQQGPSTCSGLPVQRYSIEELQEVVAPHFRLIRGINPDHQTPSGSLQAYTFGLFQRTG